MAKVVEIPVVWMQGAACTGCVVSLLNSLSPGIARLVLRELVPGKHVSLRFLVTAMAGQGRQVMDVVRDETVKDKGNYILVMEGSVPVGHPAYGTVGEEGGREIPIAEIAGNLARHAAAVVCMGTCSSFGGIPAASPNPTGCVSMGELLAREKITTPVVNIPGCPPHPDWLIGSLLAVAVYGLGPVAGLLDDLKRPKIFYGKLVHETCPRRADFDAARFAKKFGDPGCLYLLGCRGPASYADCPTRMFNSGTNWCIGAGGPCHGCVEPEFPDRFSPLYEKIDDRRMDRFRLLQKPATAPKA
ncbi:MAG: hydrogenase small subunit [Planctomycetota bacterium]|nr:hydrogenase small subunit [Planctomycetota bacterium]